INPLLSIADSYKKIHLMGQSMGVSSSFNALRRLGSDKEMMDKIGNVVGISGNVGAEKDTDKNTWDGIKMPIDEVIDYEWDYINRVDTNAVTSKDEFRDSLAAI